MKTNELFTELKEMAAQPRPDPKNTCDTYKAGSPEAEITKVAVSMFATPEVIRQAAAWGANFLIVHEPTYYNHMDSEIPFAIGEEKRALIEKSGLTIVRFHDYMHSVSPDMIFSGEMWASGLKYKLLERLHFGVTRIELEEPMTARELAALLEEKLGIAHIRIAGECDKKGKIVSCSFGTPGHTAEELADCEFLLTGEICEWQMGELARDYAQLGYNKAILVMGHIGSERAGMQYLAELLREKHPELPVRYFECGEVYQYTK